MFAADYNKKGVAFSYTVSFIVHALILIMFLMHQAKQKREMMEEYKLTEVTMMEIMPEEVKPMKVEKPKKMFDILKQIIPIKQKKKLAVSKPKKLEMDKPKMEMDKPKALDLSRKKLDKLKPADKSINLENEIGKKKISPAMVQKQLDLERKKKLAAASSKKLDISSSKKSSLLPSKVKPGIKMDSSRETSGLKKSRFKLGKPTPEPKKESLLSQDKITIERKPLLISGEISGRPLEAAVKPVYPRWAQREGIEASVTIRFTVRPDGTVKENAIIERSSGHTELDENAKEALFKFRFAPIEEAEDQSGYATFRYMLER